MLHFIIKKKKNDDDDLKKQFVNTYKFCKRGINKLILIQRKGVYLYEYMDDRKKFSATSLA